VYQQDDVDREARLVADTQGFEEFYTATVGRLLGQLFPVTGDLHEAEEIVQEVSVEALALAEALRTLPMHQRQAIVLHHLVDLRAHLQELADATREGTTPGPAAAVRRGRQRRRRIAAATASRSPGAPSSGRPAGTRNAVAGEAQPSATGTAPSATAATMVAAPTIWDPSTRSASVMPRGVVQALQPQTWPPASTKESSSSARLGKPSAVTCSA
jgi:hypothetical protein